MKILILMAAFIVLFRGTLAEAKEPAQEGFPSGSGALHVEGTKLCDAQGREVQLRGISTHGISWFSQYVNQDCFRQLRQEWGVNAVRLAMYTAESGGYCTDGNREDLKQIIRRGVQYAEDNDMYVIIDWHILSDGNPNQYLEEAKAFFQEMSAEYASSSHVLYEICNEPNGGVAWSDIKSYAEEVIPVIRRNDPEGIILVGTPNWSQYVDQAAEDPVTGYENIMYTLHFYAATHREDLRSKMEAALEAGLPVFVSEYGICDASGSGALDLEQADAWVEAMDAHNVSYMAWNLSNKDESSAILRKDCTKTSRFEAADLSESGKWLYGMLTEEKTEGAEGADSRAQGDLSGDSGENQTETRLETAKIRDGDLSCTAYLVNFWQSSDQWYFQYSLEVTNEGEESCSSWTLRLPLNEPYQLSDGWNADFTSDGKTLILQSKDYNGVLESGGTVREIGFIVRGSADLAVEKGD